jgi:structural maintenance of chromosome 3 (chondroitin sulfate proteoglycan 6)
VIFRTFRDIRTHFQDVFRELVPQGQGDLVMITKLDEDGDGDDDNEDDPTAVGGVSKSKKSGKSASKGKNASSATSGLVAVEDIGASNVSSFRGVEVRVSFSGSGQQYAMQQLSGGQKSLVALALIFAIQRCDPAPFYLFDEIDQALDSSYRKAVASLIKRQADSEETPAQFITTTFRPEFVEVADQWYGIAVHNKVSNIYPLDKVIVDCSEYVFGDLVLYFVFTYRLPPRRSS